MDFKDSWEGLTTEYDKNGSWIKFYATPNAKKAIRENPRRLLDWLETMSKGTGEFLKRELARLCTSSRS